MTFAKNMTAVAAAATMLGAFALPAAAQSSHSGYVHRHYSAAQRQAYAAGYRRGFARGNLVAAYGAPQGVVTGRSAAVDQAAAAQQGGYVGPFANGGLLGTGALNGNGVLGTGVFDGQGALGLGLFGF